MKTRALALLAFLPLIASCASQKVIKDYEAEISALRDERTALKSENQNLRGQLDMTQVALSDANSELNNARTQVANVPELPQIGGGIEVGMRGSDMVITIPSSITFASGSATLSESGKGPLRQVAKLLLSKHSDSKFWIEGHTDTDQISKSKFESNRQLSTARAMSVLKFLVEECGVPDSSCVLVGHGQYEPVADNANNTGKAKNRRVEIVVHK